MPRPPASLLTALAVALLGLAGCGYETPMSATEVEVTGTLTDAAGKPVKDVVVSFIPMSMPGQPCGYKTDAAGVFTGKVIVAKYKWVVVPYTNPGTDKANTAAMKGVPESFREPSNDRTVDIKAGVKLDLKLS